MKDEQYYESILKMRTEFQLLRESYAKAHHEEHGYRTYDDGVIHGQWVAYIHAEKLIQKALDDANTHTRPY